jgi:hypothetical protein
MIVGVLGEESLLASSFVFSVGVAEVIVAMDTTDIGNIIFATLIDDPASINDTSDAFIGEIMIEAASADTILTVGIDYVAAIDDSTSVADVFNSSPIGYLATIDEIATANDSSDAAGAVTATTWSPSDKTTPVVLGSGNLRVTTGGSSTNGGVRSTTSVPSGKAYLEYTCTNLTGGNTGAGIATSSANLATMGGSVANACLIYFGGEIYFNGVDTGKNVGAVGAGSTLCFAIDATGSLLWARLNGGSWNGSGTADPATGVGGINIAALFPTNRVFSALSVNGANVDVTANYGGSAFAQTVPSGFAAWNTLAS